MDSYCCVDGITTKSYGTAWYAFDQGNARFYILDATWDGANVGTASQYQVDYDVHWAPGAQHDEYTWLANDLAAHPGQLKFAVFRYPLHSDQSSQNSDPYLDGPGHLEALLNQYHVAIAFNGHAHIYQRNTAPPGGVISYVTGGGGAALSKIGGAGCAPTDAYRDQLEPVHWHRQQLRQRPQANLGDPGVPLPAGHRERQHGHRHTHRRDGTNMIYADLHVQRLTVASTRSQASLFFFFFFFFFFGRGGGSCSRWLSPGSVTLGWWAVTRPTVGPRVPPAQRNAPDVGQTAIPPVGDAWVSSARPTLSLGSARVLRIASQPETRSYLTFSVAGYPAPSPRRYCACPVRAGPTHPASRYTPSMVHRIRSQSPP